MSSQIHFVVTAGNCGFMHDLHRARYMNLRYALTTALRYGTHLATTRILVPKWQSCNSTNAWDQKCTVNHWIVQINNVTWHSMDKSRNNDLFSCYLIHFIFHRMKIFVPWHKWENIHYLFFITCTETQIILNKFKRKIILKKLTLAQAEHVPSRTSSSTQEVLRRRLRQAKCTHCTCCICPVWSFARTPTYLVSFLEQTSEDCIRPI